MILSFPDISSTLSSLVDIVQWRASHQPQKCAFTYHSDTEEVHLTYEELDLRSRAIGSVLQQHILPGSRALLLYPPGLDFITTFIGCLYAGVIAIPTYLPRATRQNRGLMTLSAIANNANPSIILTKSNILTSIKSTLASLAELRDLPLLTTDDISDSCAAAWKDTKIDENTLAFLQYTSGSTGTPKGVMLNHNNLLQNISFMSQSFHEPKQITCWLPPYHDMGLIGNILGSICFNATTTLLAPATFLQYPLRWLSTISQVRAETSGAPNFAYDLCSQRITLQQRAELDLSCWKVAFTGAEPIRPETLDRFVEAFAPCGFQREAFYPCYGLAEATLFVTGGPRTTVPVLQTFDEDALTHNQAVIVTRDHEHGRTLVSSGLVSQEAKVVIVDPETFLPCASNHIGEIWVTGPSIAQGYWKRPVETEAIFKAYLADSTDGPFLRTGDLGVVWNNNLFVTGRLKDLIIIRGQNYYPQDLELVVEQSHNAIRANCCVAFAVTIEEKDELVMVVEIDPHFLPLEKELNPPSNASLSAHRSRISAQEVTIAIRRSISEQFDLFASKIVLLKAGGIPRTSSGKIRRQMCREGFLAGSLSHWGDSNG